jgi:serine protease Do
MIRSKKPLVIAAICSIIGLIMGLGISSIFSFNSNGYAKDITIPKESVDILSKTNNAMAEVVAAVKPSVVNISSTHTIKGNGMHSPFFNDPFFKRFFGNEFRFFEMPKEYKQSSLGSGVIVDKDGYILTNNHVVKDADEIKVKLSDDREFKGKVIGVDPKTDLAVIKIDSNHLPVIKLGDSDKLRVGETVIAIGNPFGLSYTVTSGIISATGRANVGIADYEDFIQTDAAINPGNSGGALVNVRGELVGINTAIFSTTGGYQGIGFAIPSNMAKVVMESLIKKGKVIRGWLGVTIQPLTPDLVKQFNIGDEKGVLVGDVVEDSPAEKAGIERGDVIVEFDGKKVEDVVNLRNMVANTLPNEEVTINLIRDGKPKTVKVKIAEMPVENQKLSKTFDNQLKGVHVQGLNPELKRNLNVPKRVTGVVITDIEDGSPAQGILMNGDIIMEINKKDIHNVKDYESVVSRIKHSENTLLLIYRQNSVFYVTLSGK